ncbi:MAG: sugar phosphate isomerase/epimerase [Candidatus Micrarchaeota archaeon]|nr:sugar phosphate isomerase/epimerase [Candidatus Micrarchaeota archaeon]MDE1847716.1 sugar phosphate isomerase/epimerase [Candidatus Micrarchaeota archaeon]MDE1864145.1 sugar phosphate isomerase/epimerase [Candidatus Micrarchaeota archaeon]
MQYGLLSSAIYDLTEEIKSIKKLGFDYVEIGIEEPKATPQILIRQKAQILGLLKEYRMQALGHTSYWVGFGSSHNKVREGWIAEGKEMIHVAASLNIKLLNFHFHGGEGQSMQTKFGRDIFVSNFTDSMLELSRFAKKSKVTLMLENVPLQRNGPTIKEYSQVIENTQGLMVHLDIAHAYTEGGMKMIREYVERFSDKIAHLHIHDNHGEHDEHLPLGMGTIDFNGVASMLKGMDYNRTITLEVFTSKSDAASSMRYLKGILG